MKRKRLSLAALMFTKDCVGLHFGSKNLGIVPWYLGEKGCHILLHGTGGGDVHGVPGETWGAGGETTRLHRNQK